MAIGKNSKLTVSMTFGVVVVLGITLWNSIQSSNQELKEVVQQEDIYCISAVCISADTAIKCLELDPSISHLIITGDPQVRDASRLIIKPSDKSCGRSSLKRNRSYTPVGSGLTEK
jgi:hypothetical protein